MQIGILVYPQAANFAVTGLYSMLTYAGKNAVECGGKEFEVLLIATQKEKHIVFNDNVSIECHRTIYEDGRLNLVIVPGIESDIQESLLSLQHVTSWLIKKNKEKVVIAGSCTGSFLIAQTRLLENKRMVTHWKAASLLQKSIGSGEIDDRNLIVDHGELIISGGTGIFMNLAIYLIERFIGRKLAVKTANFFMVDINKYPQAAYSEVFSPRSHNNEKIKNAERAMENSNGESISITSMAEEACMSMRNFTRKFKDATGYSALEYMQRKKLRMACEALIFTPGTIDQIAYSLGYEDASSFRKVFKKYLGVTAMVYRDRYRQRVFGRY